LFSTPRRKVAVAATGTVFGTAGMVVALAGNPLQTPRQSIAQNLPVMRGGVTLQTVGLGGVGSGSAVRASYGDWLLESDRVRLVIGGDGRGTERELRRGMIIDLTLRDFAQDQLVDFRTVAEIGGSGALLSMETVGPVGDASRPTLRVRQQSRDGRLLLETDIAIVPGQPTIELVTRYTNNSGETLRGVRVGDRARWPGAHTFAPRAGFVRYASRASAPWIARQGKDFSYVLAFPGGPADLNFFFDLYGPTGQIALSRAVELAPGASREHRRVLSVVSGGLGDAAKVAWTLLGKPVGRVVGKLDPVPVWATVEAQPLGEKRPILRVSAEQGSYELPLPAGKYRLVLNSPGGEHSEEITVVPGAAPTEALLVPPKAGTVRYSVVDETGRLGPARIALRGVPPTKNPGFGPPDTTAGSGNIVYSRTGQGQFELSPGHYVATISRGNEYSIDEQELKVVAGEEHDLRSGLERVVDTSGWIGCDFHVHAAPSKDSTVSLEDRVVSLLAEGVEFAVATDHNHVTDYAPIVERLGAERQLATVPGVEVTTHSWGHFNAFPYPTSAPLPPYASIEPSLIFDRVRAEAPGVVIQVNHPRLRGMGYFNRLNGDTKPAAIEDGFSFDFDTVELMNGIELAGQNAVDANLDEWFELLNLGKRYTAVGNSDSHRLVGQYVGYPRTYVRVPDDRAEAVSEEQISRALLAGHAIVSGGPFVMAIAEGRAGPGDFVAAHSGTVELQLSVRAPAWMDVRRAEIYVNGQRVTTIPARTTLAPIRIEAVTPVRVRRDSWIVVAARGDKPMRVWMPGTPAVPFAFTNPIFVDADGDGVFRAPRIESTDKSAGPALSPRTAR
jgi:hypothetical protein